MLLLQVDGQDLPGMQQMLEQLKNLPPEQRQMMEQMMAQQGVSLGDQGIRICISAEQLADQAFTMPDLAAVPMKSSSAVRNSGVSPTTVRTARARG